MHEPKSKKHEFGKLKKASLFFFFPRTYYYKIQPGTIVFIMNKNTSLFEDAKHGRSQELIISPQPAWPTGKHL